MVSFSEHQLFVKSIQDSIPDFYSNSENFQDIIAPFQNNEYIVVTSLETSLDVVIDACLDFIYNHASYTDVDYLSSGNIFLKSDPIIIFSTCLEAKDRTLIWANGMISLSFESEDNLVLTLLIDKKMKEFLNV